MVRNHHESWDGRGYPDGFAGEDIPRLARVLQVADVFDAMISDRPYQPAMSEQEVLGHFKLYAGQKYDSTAVDALCAVIGEGLGRREPSPEEQAGSEVAAGRREASSLGVRGEVH